MKKFILLLMAAILPMILVLGCSSAPKDPTVLMQGEYVSETAMLKVDNYQTSGLEPSVDFQLSYQNDESAGTFFGTADQVDFLKFNYEYESLGVVHHVKLVFDEKQKTWEIEYHADNTQGKKVFDYSGTYKKK